MSHLRKPFHDNLVVVVVVRLPVLHIGSCVAHAVNIRESTIRLATFDAHLERLRVGRAVRTVLKRSLGTGVSAAFSLAPKRSSTS